MATRIQDLIVRWYGGDRDAFVEAHPDPVLLGLGVVETRRLRGARRKRSTYLMAFDALAVDHVKRTPLIAGIVFPVTGRSGPGQEEILLGRDPSCDVVLPDLSISERHCVIARGAQGFKVSDLESTNGTLLNGLTLPPPASRQLCDDDLLTVGRCTFLFYTPRVLFSYLQLVPR